MNDHDDMTTADVITAAERDEADQAAEYRLDAEQEARDAERAAAEQAEADGNPERCEAEFIDGSWYGDDCPQCRDHVQSAMADCEECQDEDGYCSKHINGAW